MSSMSVRLDPETQRQAKALRARGVVLSEVVREAIRSAYAREKERHHKTRLAVLDDALAQNPAPMEHPPRPYDVSNAAEAREAIRRHLRRKHTQ